MRHSVLFVLPAHSLALVAKSTTEPNAVFLQKAIIRLRGCETAPKIDLVDLRLGEAAHESLGIHTILEYLINPCHRRALASSSRASIFQFHGIGFVLSRWPFTRAVEDCVLRPVTCHGGGWHTADRTEGCALSCQQAT